MSVNNKRGIVSIHIGQAGCGIGDEFWRSLCEEYRLGADGLLLPSDEVVNDPIFFRKTKSNKLIPRAVFVDTNSESIERIKTTSDLKNIYDNEQFISGSSPLTSSNFAEAYNGQGSQFITDIMDRVRTCAEECPYLEGFMITRSVEGGTGSGLATRLLESLSNEYKKKTKCELCVCPKFGSNPNSDQTVYNSVLSLYKTLELVDHSICIDNKSLTSISERRLRMKLNTNENNKLVSYFMSSFTSPMRHGGVLNASLNEIVYNLQPLPRLRYSIPSIAPLISRNKDNFEKNNAIDLTNNLFLNEKQFLSCDLNNEKYLSCYMGYQGSSFEINDIYDGISKAINNHSDSFTDWSRDAFKLSLNARAPYSSIFNSNRLNTACRLANTTAFRGHLTSMAREFDLIYEKRDFVQSFVAAGMEEGDFVEARERLATLKTNYQEVLNTNDESVEAQSDDERLLERDFN